MDTLVTERQRSNQYNINQNQIELMPSDGNSGGGDRRVKTNYGNMYPSKARNYTPQ